MLNKNINPNTLIPSLQSKQVLNLYNIHFKGNINPKIIKNITKEENLLGTGKSYSAYSIDSVTDLVLRVPNHLDLGKCDSFTFHSVNKVCDKYNFGEPVVELGYGVQLLSKVDGLKNSFSNWVKTMAASVFNNSKIDNKDAEKNLKLLKAVSQLPEESYVDFAKKIKYLNTTEKTVDCINPNNVLFDFKNSKINIIDLWDVGQHKTKGQAGFDHMVALLCDGLMNKDTRDVLSKDKAKIYKELTQKIIRKCKIAAEIVDLPRSKSEILVAYDDVEKSIKKVTGKKINYVERYNIFCNDYGL